MTNKKFFHAVFNCIMEVSKEFSETNKRFGRKPLHSNPVQWLKEKEIIALCLLRGKAQIKECRYSDSMGNSWELPAGDIASVMHWRELTPDKKVSICVSAFGHTDWLYI